MASDVFEHLFDEFYYSGLSLTDWLVDRPRQSFMDGWEQKKVDRDTERTVIPLSKKNSVEMDKDELIRSKWMILRAMVDAAASENICAMRDRAIALDAVKSELAAAGLESGLEAGISWFDELINNKKGLTNEQTS